MKRIIIFALMSVMALSAVAFAGSYFGIENEGLDLQPSVVIGWDFDAPYVNTTNLSISGDFYVANDDLAFYPSPWVGGFDLAFSFANTDGFEAIEFGLGMDIELLPAEEMLEYATLEEWTTTVGIIFRPTANTDIYGFVDLVYDIGEGIWNFEPTIGLEVRWP